MKTLPFIVDADTFLVTQSNTGGNTFHAKHVTGILKEKGYNVAFFDEEMYSTFIGSNILMKEAGIRLLAEAGYDVKFFEKEKCVHIVENSIFASNQGHIDWNSALGK